MCELQVPRIYRFFIDCSEFFDVILLAVKGRQKLGSRLQSSEKVFRVHREEERSLFFAFST